MEQRLLGKSGLSVSALSFGTMTIGGRDRFQYMGTLGVGETSRMLDICSEAGVTVIDTADMYSFGGSEEVLGEALEGKRQQFAIVSKVFMRVGKGAHDIGLSRKHILESCEGSLRRLRTDYLDVYMCHEPDQFVPVEETLRAFDDLVSQGKVRYIGCSNHSAWHVMKALAVSERHTFPRYITQQVNYSLLARDVEHEMVPMATPSSSRIDSFKSASKLLNGSSINNTFGFGASALARATLCCCPPLNSCGYLFSKFLHLNKLQHLIYTLFPILSRHAG